MQMGLPETGVGFPKGVRRVENDLSGDIKHTKKVCMWEGGRD
jgi:hypothetical protein